MQDDRQRGLVKKVAARVQGGKGGNTGFLFHVMFDSKEGKVFGRTSTFCDDAYMQAKQGRIIVEHEVYPASRGPYAVKAEKLTAIKFEWNDRPKEGSLAHKLGFFHWGKCPLNDYCALEGLAHQVRVERNKGEGVEVNDMFQIGVGDGQATYVVVAVYGNRCNVEWRGMWNADRYIDHHFGWGRNSCPLTEIERYVGRKKGSDRLFAKKGPQMDKPKAFPKLLAEYQKNHGFPAPVEL